VPEPLQPALDRLRPDLLDLDRLVRAVGAGRRRGLEPPQHRKVELRPVDLADGRRLQVTRYDERHASIANLDADGAGPAVAELLAAPYGNWHVETTDATVQLRVTKRGEAQVHRGAPAATPERTHDRAKPRLLDPTAPYLRALGLTDAAGRVKPSRQAKLRQVEELLRALDPVLDRLAGAGPPAEEGRLRVADLGCGNGYLTFATYDRLVRRFGPDAVAMTGVDAKVQSREHGTRVAAELGWTGLRFVAASITEVELDPPPHLVLALHACDTATDDALARAVHWGARAILAAPCCHHELQAQLRTDRTPTPYALLTRHGILRERFADGLTDALRANALRLLGYRVDVVEFVDSRHTPRNVLLRAVRTGSAPSAAAVAEHRALVADWGVSPALDRLLAAELAALG
jgi:SAM-dependent methyltransferase